MDLLRSWLAVHVRHAFTSMHYPPCHIRALPAVPFAIPTRRAVHHSIRGAKRLPKAVTMTTEAALVAVAFPFRDLVEADGFAATTS